MEADWEVEIGGPSPIIDACWHGFVDLRYKPGVHPAQYLMRAQSLPESKLLPHIAQALVNLNTLGSPVWTSKCDVWPVSDHNPSDSDELAAPRNEASHAWACYIDLLPRSDQQWITPDLTVRGCKAWCDRLRAIPLTHCRADLIVRQAIIAPEIMTYGITAYLTACGATSKTAKAALSEAIDAFAQTICLDSKLK